METNIIYNEDCFETLKRLGDNSIDAIVTDPPYSIGFMGKNWDKTGIAERVDLWQECLRVLKPGGNLLSFGGTRTYYRMVCAIEDAGFEIRDCIMWVYGSGFPKSLNIGKAVDKKLGNGREYIGKYHIPSDSDAGNAGKVVRSVTQNGGCFGATAGKGGTIITKGTSEWGGYGTALKPAYEPIVLAMKPLNGTFAENCLKWGVGGLNIDQCRIPTDWSDRPESWKRSGFGQKPTTSMFGSGGTGINTSQGRFPANLILDGSQEVMELFPETKSGSGIKSKGGHSIGMPRGEDAYHFKYDGNSYNGDSGSAARFFYCAKASKKERNAGLEEPHDYGYRANGFSANISDSKLPRGNTHPTVKPLALMEYLVKLVTRPQHIVFDPFIGSGTTAIACVKLDRHYIGCELDKDYYNIALKRIKAIEG